MLKREASRILPLILAVMLILSNSIALADFNGNEDDIGIADFEIE